MNVVSRANFAPLLVGTLAILGVAVYLTLHAGSPGDLTAAHAALADLDELQGCARCHSDEGLDRGCLGCHAEIARQLADQSGYHRARGGDCATCHPEHHGATFDLMEGIAWGKRAREAFDHDHVDFGLTGEHTELGCETCHGKGRFTLPAFDEHPRSETFLGLSQTCETCHENAHEARRFAACEECHDQEAFDPAARFAHAKLLPLAGGHHGLACTKCHLFPEGDGVGDFGRVKGKTCAECHRDPHQTDWQRACEACHGDQAAPWTEGARGVSAQVHAMTGFRLHPPHDTVACEACHAAGLSYVARYPDPGTRQESRCNACHTDVHGGQFTGRYASCLECHARERFRPSLVGRAQHRLFPLRGAHGKVACDACHVKDPVTGVRRFAKTPRECKACHADPHQGQFAGKLARAGCDQCHNETHFRPARYDLAQHDAFPLAGAHRAVACTACHRSDDSLGARRFTGNARQCRACHADPHGGQFATELKRGDCAACHRKDARTFSIRPFDHGARTGHALTGAHAKATCAQCHRQSGGSRLYRKTPASCASCHADIHRGQFGRRARCERCHSSATAWRATGFDHGTDTRFALDARHRRVACGECHPTVRQPDGAGVVQFKPIGTKCGDCHDFIER